MGVKWVLIVKNDVNLMIRLIIQQILAIARYDNSKYFLVFKNNLKLLDNYKHKRSNIFNKSVI